MSDEPEHVTKLRAVYAQWNDTKGASAEAWLDLMADDVAMRSLPAGNHELSFTKGRDGKAQAAAYFAGLVEDWELIHFTPAEFIASGDRVVVLSRVAFRFRKTGKVAESPKADVFRFRDGLIVECAEFFDTAGAFAATRPDA